MPKLRFYPVLRWMIHVVYLNDMPWSFGRELDSGTNYVIQKKNISALHCTIHYNPDQREFSLVDEQSGNGTYLDGKQLSPHVKTPLKGAVDIQLARQSPVLMRFTPMIISEQDTDIENLSDQQDIGTDLEITSAGIAKTVTSSPKEDEIITSKMKQPSPSKPDPSKVEKGEDEEPPTWRTRSSVNHASRIPENTDDLESTMIYREDDDPN